MIKEPKIKTPENWKKECPWGLIFAERANFEWGYFKEEKRLVDKYIKPSDRVLIIGSGNGREARPICSSVARLVCLDISLLYLESGKKLFSREKNSNVFFVQADMLKLPFRKESFDFVFFSLYSPADAKRQEAVEEITRVLSPGGRALICACTQLYPKIHKKMRKMALIDSPDQLKNELSFSALEFLEGSIDTERPEYMFSMARKRQGE